MASAELPATWQRIVLELFWKWQISPAIAKVSLSNQMQALNIMENQDKLENSSL